MRCCSLGSAPVGCKMRVRRLRGCPRERGRLCALGITPGTEVEVCSRFGGCRVRVHDTSLVLGDTVADTIECEPVAK